MTASRKTGLLRFSASRCLALIVKEWHQIGRDPSALVIGVFLPLFMLLVCGFGISMDMKDVPVAIVLEERTPVAQRIAVDFTANPYFDAKVFYAKALAEKALEAREVECILTIPAGFAANAQQGEAAELGLTVYGVDSNSATLFKSYVLGQLNNSVTKMVSNGMIEPAVASRVSAGPVKSLASRSWFNERAASSAAMRCWTSVRRCMTAPIMKSTLRKWRSRSPVLWRSRMRCPRRPASCWNRS